MQLLKAGERGVNVRLIEYLAAVDQIALDRENVDPAPLGFKARWRDPMPRPGDNRSEVAQPTHSLDVNAARAAVERRADVCGRVTGCDPWSPPGVDIHPIRRRRGRFWRVDGGGAPRDDRPRGRVGGCFAGEVPSIEFFEGGVDVVEIEHDGPCDP